jgi:UDP-3-O-[3-hydroxymyristoyl] glucosamine N-acyltransferase
MSGVFFFRCYIASGKRDSQPLHMQISFSVEELAAIVQAKSTRGRYAGKVTGIGSLDTARAGDLSFLGNTKYKPQVATTGASVILLPEDFAGEPKDEQVFLIVEKPSVALARICSRVEQALWPKPAPGIHPTAVVERGAQVASSATVGPLCIVQSGARIGERTHLEAAVFVGHDATVGDDCWLMPRTVLGAECVLKNRVRLQPGVIIGSDGFGYEFVAGRHEKVPQVGAVLVGDDVEIGANSTVDRARFSQTVIGEGTKIDNLVQVAHNVVIGKHCIICAQVGISGSTTLEDYVIIGGQAGLAGHIRIGRGSRIDGQSGVNGDLDPQSFVKGSPSQSFNFEQRINVLKRKLPDLFKRVNALEEQLKKTSAST